MPGSGKSAAAKVIAEELGYPIVVMGDFVREETRRRGLELTSENVERVARELREERGPAAVAEMVASHLGSLGVPGAVIDGARSLSELEVFSSLGRVIIVAVHSPPRLRLERMLARSREGDVRNEREFRMRDLSNLSLGVGSLIALADYMIVNISDLATLEREARRVAQEIRREERDRRG